MIVKTPKNIDFEIWQDEILKVVQPSNYTEPRDDCQPGSREHGFISLLRTIQYYRKYGP